MQVYRPRKPEASPLWQCISNNFEAFLDEYEERHQPHYGFLRPVITDVVHKYLDCGNLERGFARVRCDHCEHEYLLAFSCKGRWFCPSCHQKKVQLFGALLCDAVLFPVPHRHYVLGIPKMLRPYFRNNRDLLKDLCHIAHESIFDYMKTILRMPHGIPGIVMTIHTFGEYLDFHPHLHALVADGLFARSGMFHVLPRTGIKPLEKLFRARLIAFLVEKGLLPADRARMLMGWKHSGFNVHHSRRVNQNQKEDPPSRSACYGATSMGRLAQYIIRSPFSLEKMQFNRASQTVIYRSEMNQKIHRNFEIFTPTDFIAAITQHIPDKSFQLVRYYGWYSNKMRGQRYIRAAQKAPTGAGKSVIDVSDYEPRRIPSAKWCELIKKVWEADPLLCPNCHSKMRIIALINESEIIERILRHLGLLHLNVRACPPSTAQAPPTIPPDEWLDLSRRSHDWTEGDGPFPDYDTEPVMAYANE